MRLRAVITEYQAAMKRAAGDTAAMSKSAQGSFTELNKKVGDLGAELTRKVTVPLVATGAGALKLASDFDTSFAQMVGLAGVAGDEVAGLREEVLSLAKGTAVGPQKLAEALYFVRSSGIDAAHAMDVVTASAKASAAGMGEPAVIARTLSAAINAYGASNLSAAHATDVLVAGIRAASFEPDQLAASLGTVIATASTMGITFDNLIATLAVLSRTGLDAAEATTSLNAILTMLSNGGAAATQLLAAHGLSLQKLRDIAAGPGGVIEAMRLLDETFGDDQEALSTIIPNVRAFRGAMTLLAQDASIVDGVMADVEDSTNSAAEAFAAVKDTWSFKLKQGIVEVQTALIRLGELLGPMAAVFGATIGAIATAFGRLPVPIQQVVVSLLAVAAAAGPLMKVFGSLAGPAVDAIKSIAAGLRTLRAEIIASQIAGMSYGQALATSLAPIGLTLAAVAVVAIGATTIWKNYAKEKAQAAADTRDFVAALREERDAVTGENAPKPTKTEALKKIFAGDLGAELREGGADMTAFADIVLKGSDALKTFADAADPKVAQLLKDHLEDAAKGGDELAQQLLALQAATGLSDADLARLVIRLNGLQSTFGAGSQAVQNETYAMQQAAGAANDLRAQQAGLDVAVSDFSDTMSDSARATLEAALATARQAREWDIANQSVAGLAQGVANLLSFIDALFGSTFDAGKAQQGFADAVSDVDGAMVTGGGSTRDLEKDQRNLERATKDVTTAQKDLADAEAALAEARKGPSAREKSDAALDVREATLAVKEATKAQADARKKLLEERDKGKEGDVAGARLDVEAASIRLKRAQDRLTDSQKAQNDVLHSGEETSKDVTSALDDLEKAQQAVADATERQIDAEKVLRGEGASGGPVADRARTLRGTYDNLTVAGQSWITKLIEMGAPTSTVMTALDAQAVAVQKVIDKYGDANGTLSAYLGWLKEVARQISLMDPNNPAALGQGGADYGIVSFTYGRLPGRAKGGPALPFETYEMGEDGPEALTIGTTRPPDKLGKGAAAAEMSGRSATGARTFMVGLDGPQVITMGAQAGWVTPHHKLGDIDGARAAGGPVLAGRTYLVGEQGPEIMTVGAQSAEQLLEQRTAAATTSSGPAPSGPTPTGGRDPRSVAEIVAARTAKTAALRRAAVQRRQARTAAAPSDAVGASGGMEAANYQSGNEGIGAAAPSTVGPSVNEGLRNSAMPWSGQLAAASSMGSQTIVDERSINVIVELDNVQVANSLIRLSKHNGGLPIRIRSGN